MINAILEEVANEPSKNAKIAILTQHKDNDVLQEVVRLTYDPTVNFFIKKIPAYTPRGTADNEGHSQLDFALFNLVREVASRNYTGNKAIEYVTQLLERLTVEDAKVLAKVIDRDLRAGFGESTANKVWKNLIPEFPYMRCALPKAAKLDEFSWADGVFSQLKADGMFANVNHTADGEVQILSRAGSLFPQQHFAHLVADVQATFPTNTQSHGELLIKRDGVVLPRQLGNGILNKVQKGGDIGPNDEIVYLVWDQIALTSVVSKGTYNVPYKARFATLKEQTLTATCITLIPTVIVHNMEDALTHYREMLAEGLEGTIIKDATGIWKDTTSKDQVKMKLDIDVDLVIMGFNAGNGKNEATFGSIVCQSSDGLLEVNISGFTDEVRLEVHNNRDKLIGTIVTVKGNSIMPPTGNNTKYSLFLPRFAEFRTDKKVADDLAKVIEQFDNAIK
jgi:DNA ligase-1